VSGSDIRHVLVVTGGRDVAQVLRRLRPELVITVMLATGSLHRVRRPDLYARVIALDGSSATADWIALAKHVNARLPIDAVAAFGELDQDRAADIAVALGLPFHSRDVIDVVYDKVLMRRRLAARGVDPTVSAPVTTARELKRFADEHGLPLILKPARGTGSESVTKLATHTELEGILARLATVEHPEPMVVEPYLAGPEISVEAFSERGAHRVVGITSKSVDANFVEVGHVVREASAADAAVAGYVTRVLDALGITDGPTHTELILTAVGPRVVETHTRAGGDQIPQLLTAASGIDLIELAVRQALGERVLPVLDALLSEPDRPARFGAIRYLVSPAPGRLSSVRNVAVARVVPLVTGCRVLLEPGHRLTVPVASSGDRIAYCTAVADDAAAAARAAARAVELLDVELDPAEAQP
jgi:biotin carboxylase